MNTLRIIFLVLATLVTLSQALAQDRFVIQSVSIKQLGLDNLNKSATLAAKKLGRYEHAAISCDANFIVCSCSGAIDCAWLALACGEAGGIQGFDGECYFPDSVPGAKDAIKSFASLSSSTEASCDGIFCSCSGPAGSEDCKKLKACADDISCVGNNCGCIGGHTD